MIISNIRITYKRILITIFIVSAAIFTGVYNMAGNEVIIESVSDDPPVAINHILTNELSDIPETERLDAQIESFMRQWAIKGASLAVMKDEKLVYAKGYGWADEQNKERTDVRHVFRIASISKLVTSAAIMKLCEEGKLSLNHKPFAEGGILDIQNFEEIRDRRVKEITVDNLLRHRAGFSNRAGDPMFNLATIGRRLKLNRAVYQDELISYVLSQRLGYSPGTGTTYSNIGYLILSRLIEEISGVSYEEYVKENLLKPAGVYDMHIANNYYSQKFHNEVRYYYPQDEDPITAYDGSGKLKPRPYGGNNIQLLSGAGGWVASPAELLKFVSAIDGKDGVPDLLSKESIEIMTNSSSSMLPAGWSRCSGGVWTRTGTLSGSSAMLRYNKNGYSWVFITNTSSWRGAAFPSNIDAFFRGAMQRVASWPERDLFEVKTQLSHLL